MRMTGLTAKAFASTPPPEIDVSTVAPVPSNWQDQLNEMCVAYDSNLTASLQKYIGDQSTYTSKQNLIEQLKIIYYRLTGQLDTQLGELKPDVRDSILLKLTEGIGNSKCPEGLHGRANLIITSMQIPNTLAHLLYKVRLSLVTNAVTVLTEGEIHRANRATIVAKENGFGIEANLASDTLVAGGMLTIPDDRILETLESKFAAEYTPLSLPLLLCYELRGILTDSLGYQGRKEGGGHFAGEVEAFSTLIKAFFGIPQGSAPTGGPFEYIVIEEDDNDDMYFRDINWRHISDLFLRELKRQEYVTTSPIPKQLATQLWEYAYYLPEAEALEKIREQTNSAAPSVDARQDLIKQFKKMDSMRSEMPPHYQSLHFHTLSYLFLHNDGRSGQIELDQSYFADDDKRLRKSAQLSTDEKRVAIDGKRLSVLHGLYQHGLIHPRAFWEIDENHIVFFTRGKTYYGEVNTVDGVKKIKFFTPDNTLDFFMRVWREKGTVALRSMFRDPSTSELHQPVLHAIAEDPSCKIDDLKFAIEEESTSPNILCAVVNSSKLWEISQDSNQQSSFSEIITAITTNDKFDRTVRSAVLEKYTEALRSGLPADLADLLRDDLKDTIKSISIPSPERLREAVLENPRLGEVAKLSYECFVDIISRIMRRADFDHAAKLVVLEKYTEYLSPSLRIPLLCDVFNLVINESTSSDQLCAVVNNPKLSEVAQNQNHALSFFKVIETIIKHSKCDDAVRLAILQKYYGTLQNQNELLNLLVKGIVSDSTLLKIANNPSFSELFGQVIKHPHCNDDARSVIFKTYGEELKQDELVCFLDNIDSVALLETVMSKLRQTPNFFIRHFPSYVFVEKVVKNKHCTQDMVLTILNAELSFYNIPDILSQWVIRVGAASCKEDLKVKLAELLAGSALINENIHNVLVELLKDQPSASVLNKCAEYKGSNIEILSRVCNAANSTDEIKFHAVQNFRGKLTPEALVEIIRKTNSKEVFNVIANSLFSSESLDLAQCEPIFTAMSLKSEVCNGMEEPVYQKIIQNRYAEITLAEINRLSSNIKTKLLNALIALPRASLPPEFVKIMFDAVDSYKKRIAICEKYPNIQEIFTSIIDVLKHARTRTQEEDYNCIFESQWTTVNNILDIFERVNDSVIDRFAERLANRRTFNQADLLYFAMHARTPYQFTCLQKVIKGRRWTNVGDKRSIARAILDNAASLGHSIRSQEIVQLAKTSQDFIGENNLDGLVTYLCEPDVDVATNEDSYRLALEHRNINLQNLQKLAVKVKNANHEPLLRLIMENINYDYTVATEIADRRTLNDLANIDSYAQRLAVIQVHAANKITAAHVQLDQKLIQESGAVFALSKDIVKKQKITDVLNALYEHISKSKDVKLKKTLEDCVHEIINNTPQTSTPVRVSRKDTAGYSLALMPETLINLEKNKLYVRKRGVNIEYITKGMTEIQVITPNNFRVYKLIVPDLTDLVAAKKSILTITSERGHTQDEVEAESFSSTAKECFDEFTKQFKAQNNDDEPKQQNILVVFDETRKNPTGTVAKAWNQARFNLWKKHLLPDQAAGVITAENFQLLIGVASDLKASLEISGIKKFEGLDLRKIDLRKVHKSLKDDINLLSCSLNGAHITGKQFEALVKSGRSDFTGVKVVGDIEKITVSDDKRINFENADLSQANFTDFKTYLSIRSLKNAQLNNQQVVQLTAGGQKERLLSTEKLGRTMGIEFIRPTADANVPYDVQYTNQLKTHANINAAACKNKFVVIDPFGPFAQPVENDESAKVRVIGLGSYNKSAYEEIFKALGEGKTFAFPKMRVENAANADLIQIDLIQKLEKIIEDRTAGMKYKDLAHLIKLCRFIASNNDNGKKSITVEMIDQGAKKRNSFPSLFSFESPLAGIPKEYLDAYKEGLRSMAPQARPRIAG